MMDRRISEQVPNAAALVCAVKDHDDDEIHRILYDADLTALTLALAEIVPEDVPMHLNRPWALDRYITAAATVMEVPRDMILSPAKHTRATHARQIVCYLAYEDATLTLTEIGRQVGRHHATVLHAIRRVRESPRLVALAHLVQQEVVRPPGLAPVTPFPAAAT